MLSHVLDSWRPKTKGLYATYQRRWNTFCVIKGVDPLEPGINPPLSFLCELFDKGLRYSALNTARSALSCIIKPFDGVPFGQHPLTIRVLKSFYNKRPPCARYSAMWNPQIVIDHVRELIPLRSLSLKMLTLKVVILFLLSTCSRQQRLLSVKRSNIKWECDGSVSIRIDEVQKHSTRGKSLEIIKLKPFLEDKGVCVIATLKAYLDRTQEITNAGDALLCSFQPPHKGVGLQTVSRWTKEIMARSGIDVSVYKAHSTRGASASGMASAGMPLNDILRLGAWSHVSTFKQFYLRPVN